MLTLAMELNTKCFKSWNDDCHVQTLHAIVPHTFRRIGCIILCTIDYTIILVRPFRIKFREECQKVVNRHSLQLYLCISKNTIRSYEVKAKVFIVQFYVFKFNGYRQAKCLESNTRTHWGYTCNYDVLKRSEFRNSLLNCSCINKLLF